MKKHSIVTFRNKLARLKKAINTSQYKQQKHELKEVVDELIRITDDLEDSVKKDTKKSKKEQIRKLATKLSEWDWLVTAMIKGFFNSD